MKAFGDSFSVIRNSYRYEIPFFQRRYVWDEENWKELLDSLSDPNDCPFLGSIIIKKNKTADDRVFWTVIDGQQRLTTLSILMRACYDELLPLQYTERYRPKYDDEDPWSEKVRVPFSETSHVRDENDNRCTKILHSRVDHIDFEKVMGGELKESYLNVSADSSSRIISCYCYFRNELHSRGIDVVDSVWRYLTKKVDESSDNGKYLVIIELGNKENEQAIFDTINTAGVRLTCADTIKNSLFQRYIDLLRNNGSSAEQSLIKATKLYDDEWDSMFSSSAESVAYWNKSRQVGRLFRDNIELLLHCIAVIDGFFDPSVKKLSDLPQCYKDYILNLSCDELESFIKKIKTYAKLYKDNFDELTEKTLYSYNEDDYLTRIMHIVDVLDISTFLPYILYLLYSGSLDGQINKDRFISLERYLILHAICGESTKNYNKECIQLINGTTIDTLLLSCNNINTNQYNYNLRHMNSNKIATLLLFWVELYKRNAERVDIKELHYVFTLEHIMPQKWEEHWSTGMLPVYDEEGNIVVDENRSKQIRTEAVYEIGNMTLLNGKLNSSVSNHTFDKKVNGEGRKRGMNKLADCLITKELLERSSWSEKDIRERTYSIVKLISTIWGISFN